MFGNVQIAKTNLQKLSFLGYLGAFIEQFTIILVS